MRQLVLNIRQSFASWSTFLSHRGLVEGNTLVIVLAACIGVLAGYGAVFFSAFIRSITDWTYGAAVNQADGSFLWVAAIIASPVIGLLIAAYLTRTFAPEAQGHGVPEVITAVARHDGVIRPQVALIKVLASGICIGTGGSIGREGPIVQIGATLGSVAGQFFKLSSRNIKILLAAGGAAGISATFNAPLAGVIFASEIILGTFAVESLTPIVIASVLADVVQRQIGEHGVEPAFLHFNYNFGGAWGLLPSFTLLGLIAGIAAVAFTRLLYATEDVADRWFPVWWHRAVVAGLLVGVVGAFYPRLPPAMSNQSLAEVEAGQRPLPATMGVGYGVVDHALHLQTAEEHTKAIDEAQLLQVGEANTTQMLDKQVWVERTDMLAEFLWLLPLVFLKPILTSITLAGGGSGGIFAPSLFLGALLGACLGIIANWVLPPDYCASPGIYAIVGMGAVVSGTTHGSPLGDSHRL